MATYNPPRLPAAIPQPEDNTPSILAVLHALKESVEWLLGVRRGSDPVARVFVQNDQPTPHTPGDLWIMTQPSLMVQYWDGTMWMTMLVAHSDGSLHDS